MYEIEKFYKRRIAKYESMINEKDRKLRELDVEIVYLWLTNNKSLDEALNHKKIPPDEREEFVRELIVKYPDAKDYIS